LINIGFLIKISLATLNPQKGVSKKYHRDYKHHTEIMFEEELYNFRKELENLGYCKTVINNYPKYVIHFLDFIQEISTKITANQIKDYHKHLQEKPNQVRQGTLSQSYIHSQLLAIRMYFEYLERISKINRNPFTLRLKSPVNEVKIILTQEEIQSLYNHCKSLEETIILHLCYGCGLRRTEAQNLNKTDINIEKKLLFVRKGKGKKRRVIPITEGITEDFKLFLKHQINTEELPFLIDNRGNRMSGNTIYKVFKNLLKKAKIQEVTLHHLRHSIATHLLENDMSIEMVRDFLGHQQLSTTQIYTRINQVKMK
jgi:integrase/recombinase XerD